MGIVENNDVGFTAMFQGINASPLEDGSRPRCASLVFVFSLDIGGVWLPAILEPTAPIVVVQIKLGCTRPSDISARHLVFENITFQNHNQGACLTFPSFFVQDPPTFVNQSLNIQRDEHEEGQVRFSGR